MNYHTYCINAPNREVERGMIVPLSIYHKILVMVQNKFRGVQILDSGNVLKILGRTLSRKFAQRISKYGLANN